VGAAAGGPVRRADGQRIESVFWIEA